MTLDYDSALVDNDEAGVIGPGVVRNFDLLLREHAGHVRHAEETHTQYKRPLIHRPRTKKDLAGAFLLQHK